MHMFLYLTVICNTVIGASQSGLATAKSTWLNGPQEEAAGRRVLKLYVLQQQPEGRRGWTSTLWQ